MMKIIKCNFDYASQILDIFNEAILHTTALYDYEPWTMETMKSWFDTKNQKNLPIIGIVDEDNHLLGFGTYGVFRVRPAYKYTVENSLYVRKDQRGKGLGKILLTEIIKHVAEQDYHSIIGVIDSENHVSIRLHKSFGFERVGELKEVGYKFGRWLNVEFLQLNLETPEHPVEG